jgi:hypothetical protein
MNGCSLDDAFPMDDGAPSPGCHQSYASKEARREERKKARRCKGPPMAFLDVKDPDRQHISKTPDVPAMNMKTGLKQHEPVGEQYAYEPFGNYVSSRHAGGASEPFGNYGSSTQGFVGGPNPSPALDCQNDKLCQQLRELMPRSDDDPTGDKVRSQFPNVPNTMPASVPKKNYFGADPEDGFANYMPEAQNFLMEPTLSNGFGIGNAPSASLPVPSVSDYWKPLTPAGVETSFFKALPKPGGTYSRKDKVKEVEYEDSSLSRKMDQIMSRLDDLQRRTGGSPEQAQTEILLFISSGVFVLFLMDLLVKKGGKIF